MKQSSRPWMGSAKGLLKKVSKTIEQLSEVILKELEHEVEGEQVAGELEMVDCGNRQA